MRRVEITFPAVEPRRGRVGRRERFVLLAVLAVTTIGRRLDAVEGELRFSRLSVEDGLSQSSVLEIAQDRMGFLWFATEEGLSRYDGTHFVTHVARDQPGFLADSNIKALVEDPSGDLWVGTSRGLHRMELATGPLRFARAARARGDRRARRRSRRGGTHLDDRGDQRSLRPRRDATGWRRAARHRGRAPRGRRHYRPCGCRRRPVGSDERHVGSHRTRSDRSDLAGGPRHHRAARSRPRERPGGRDRAARCGSAAAKESCFATTRPAGASTDSRRRRATSSPCSPKRTAPCGSVRATPA
jgi:hypothetical protein